MGGFDVVSIVNALLDPSVWINGLLIGSVYALLGIGLTMIWGVVDVINLTHGELVMLGAYGTYSTMTLFSGAATGSLGVFVVSMVVTMVMIGVLGYLIQRVLVNRVMDISTFLTLLLTFGVALVMRHAARIYYTATPRTINVSFPGPDSYELMGAVVPASRLLIFVLALLLTGLFYLFLQRTRTGRAIRAAGQNEQAAELIGIDIDHIYGVTFGVSAALVAATGGLFGIIYSFQPQIGLRYLLKSFVVVVIGGLGSIVGALMGGMLLALTEQVGAAIWGTRIIDAIAFTTLVVFLIVKPHGFFGEAEANE